MVWQFRTCANTNNPIIKTVIILNIRNKVYKSEIVSLLVISLLFLCTTYYKDNYEIFNRAYVNLDNLYRGNSIETFGNNSLLY